MSVKWNNIYNPSFILEKIESTRKINIDGKVEFDWQSNEYDAVLFSMLIFPENIPEIDAKSLISRALFSVGKKGKLSSRNLLSEINKLENEYQLAPIIRYYLSTSISINSTCVLNRLIVDDKVVLFRKQKSIKYLNSVSQLLEHAKSQLFADPPSFYLPMRIYVSAKTVYEASQQAIDTIDFIRGIWNFGRNCMHTFRTSFGGKPNPVNKYILGPIHTLHFPNGKLAHDSVWWYEPSYLGEISTTLLSKNEIIDLYKHYHSIMAKINKCNYSSEIKNAIIRYTRALDERNWNTSFLKLWGVLELLTGTTGAKYDDTIKRTAFLYEERDYNFYVLQHLRNYRNNSVHNDRENSEIETYMYQLKNYVEALLVFHLGNRYGFKTIEDAGNFLSLPYKRDEYTDQIKRLLYVKKYRRDS